MVEIHLFSFLPRSLDFLYSNISEIKNKKKKKEKSSVPFFCACSMRRISCSTGFLAALFADSLVSVTNCCFAVWPLLHSLIAFCNRVFKEPLLILPLSLSPVTLPSSYFSGNYYGVLRDDGPPPSPSSFPFFLRNVNSTLLHVYLCWSFMDVLDFFSFSCFLCLSLQSFVVYKFCLAAHPLDACWLRLHWDENHLLNARHGQIQWKIIVCLWPQKGSLFFDISSVIVKRITEPTCYTHIWNDDVTPKSTPTAISIIPKMKSCRKKNVLKNVATEVRQWELVCRRGMGPFINGEWAFH